MMQEVKTCDMFGCYRPAIQRCAVPDCTAEVCEVHLHKGRCLLHVPLDELAKNPRIGREVERLLGL